MSAVSRADASHAIGQCMIEMAQKNPRSPVGDAAYMLTREAALQMLAYRGSKKAAAALYAPADELVGAQ